MAVKIVTDSGNSSAFKTGRLLPKNKSKFKDSLKISANAKSGDFAFFESCFKKTKNVHPLAPKAIHVVLHFKILKNKLTVEVLQTTDPFLKRDFLHKQPPK
ncbi:MAG: hypothetical protein ACK4M4_11200, partial [Flavobacterium sp.]